MTDTATDPRIGSRPLAPGLAAYTDPGAGRLRNRSSSPAADAPREWYRITNQADDDTVRIDIYEEIGGWFGIYADEFITELRAITASTIELHLNTPGGSVFEGIAIYNALLDHPATINVHIDGLAASIGSVIAQAGDHVTMASGAQMMIHCAWGLCVDNASGMRDFANLLDKIDRSIAGVYTARSGAGAVDEWLAAMVTETWYTAEEAVAAGLADTYTAPGKRGGADDDPPTDRWDLSLFQHAGRSQAPPPPDMARRAPTSTPAEDTSADDPNPPGSNESDDQVTAAGSDLHTPRVRMALKRHVSGHLKQGDTHVA